jgi:hypothetical protein
VRDPGPEGRAPEEAHQGFEARVVETAAHHGEQPDQQLDPGEEAERRAGGDALAPAPSKVAADTEPGHEGGDDERHRRDADTGVEGEDPLPHDLIGEGRSSAHEKCEADQAQARRPRSDDR